MRIVAPGSFGGQDRTVYERRIHPIWIHQPGDRANVPQRFRARKVVLIVGRVDLAQVIPDRAAPLDVALQLSLSRRETVGDVEAGNVHERNAAIKDEARRVYILLEIELGR